MFFNQMGLTTQVPMLDSMKLNNGTPGIEVAVSNLVNNMYSRDIAKKIRAALETNWKNGKKGSFGKTGCIAG